MSDEQQPHDANNQQAAVKDWVKDKSHIIHFTGPNSTAIDLKKIEAVRRNGKTIFFHSATRDYPVDMEDEATAESFFPTALNLWVEWH